MNSIETIWVLYIGGDSNKQVIENFEIARKKNIWGSKSNEAFSHDGTSLKSGDIIILICGYQRDKNGPNKNRYKSIEEMKELFLQFNRMAVCRCTSDVYVDHSELWNDDIYPFRFNFDILSYFENYSLSSIEKTYSDNNLESFRLSMIPPVKIHPLNKKFINFSNLIEGIFLYPEELSINNEFIEGSKNTIIVNAYERNQKAREVCIEHYGFNCYFCGFDFKKKFGAIGEGYIHVHHIKPLSEIDEEYIVDPIKDLIPVCPNCHAMIHRKDPPFTKLDFIKLLIK